MPKFCEENLRMLLILRCIYSYTVTLHPSKEEACSFSIIFCCTSLEVDMILRAYDGTAFGQTKPEFFVKDI